MARAEFVFKQRLSFLIASLESADSAERAATAARHFLVQQHHAQQQQQQQDSNSGAGVHNNNSSSSSTSGHSLRAQQQALLEILRGLDICSKHAARLRLQLALDPIVKSQLTRRALAPLVPTIVKQALQCLSTHCRHDAGATQALAALLAGVAQRLTSTQPQQQQQQQPAGTRPASAAGPWLFDELLAPLIRSSYRDPEARRVAAGCQVLCAVLTAMAAASAEASGTAAVALRAGLAAALEHMWRGGAAQRVSAAYAPFVPWLAAVGGARLGAEGARRLVAICCRGAADKDAWQVRREALQTLAALLRAVAQLAADGLAGASGQQRQPPQQEQQQEEQQQQQSANGVHGAVLAQRARVQDAIKRCRHDAIAGVRAAAAEADAALALLLSGAAAGGDPGSTQPQPSVSVAANGGATASSPRPSFHRPKCSPHALMDFGVQVFAPPSPQSRPSPSRPFQLEQDDGVADVEAVEEEEEEEEEQQQQQQQAEEEQEAEREEAEAEGQRPSPLGAAGLAAAPPHAWTSAAREQLGSESAAATLAAPRADRDRSVSDGGLARVVEHVVHGRVEVSLCASPPSALASAAASPVREHAPAAACVGSPLLSGANGLLSAALGFLATPSPCGPDPARPPPPPPTTATTAVGDVVAHLLRQLQHPSPTPPAAAADRATTSDVGITTASAVAVAPPPMGCAASAPLDAMASAAAAPAPTPPPASGLVKALAAVRDANSRVDGLLQELSFSSGGGGGGGDSSGGALAERPWARPHQQPAVVAEEEEEEEGDGEWFVQQQQQQQQGLEGFFDEALEEEQEQAELAAAEEEEQQHQHLTSAVCVQTDGGAPQVECAMQTDAQQQQQPADMIAAKAADADAGLMVLSGDSELLMSLSWRLQCIAQDCALHAQESSFLSAASLPVAAMAQQTLPAAATAAAATTAAAADAKLAQHYWRSGSSGGGGGGGGTGPAPKEGEEVMMGAGGEDSSWAIHAFRAALGMGEEAAAAEAAADAGQQHEQRQRQYLGILLRGG